MYGACLWSFWTVPADIVVETWVKNCTARFYNHSSGMKSYLLKSNFKFDLQKHHFVYVYKVIIKCYLNFITCLYSPLALIRWNSSHCHLMVLFFKEQIKFQGKIWFKQYLKNCMAKNNFRVTSIFKIIFRICMKNIEFCRKTSKFLPRRCLFMFCIFNLNEKELNKQVCLIK